MADWYVIPLLSIEAGGNKGIDDGDTGTTSDTVKSLAILCQNSELHEVERATRGSRNRRSISLSLRPVHSVKERSHVERNYSQYSVLIRVGTHVAHNDGRIHSAFQWLCGKSGKIGALSP
jgi:hypothetical protein